VVNLEALAAKFKANETVTPEALVEAGLVRPRLPVKVLGGGEIDRPLNIQAHAFTRTARQKLEQAGGSAEVLGEGPQKRAE
jgi:large subunit ribosomal protein L15